MPTIPFEPTLDNCHEEPIHIPGSIQSHGLLIALDSETLHIKFVSENVLEHTGIHSDQILGQRVDALLGKEFSSKLSEYKYLSDFQSINPLKVTITKANGDIRSADAILSLNKYLIIDLEFSNDDSIMEFNEVYHQIRNFVSNLSTIEALPEIYNQSVNEIRRMTGFDRIMLYQFDQDYNGEVVAE